MTYGQIRLRLSKFAPGVDLDLIDGWIQNRYQAILDRLPWRRLDAQLILQSPPSYQTGTVNVTQGSTTITGVGTTWTSAMNGFYIRINNTSEFYYFTYVNATQGTLDRAYEQPTNTGLGYRIDQAIFSLPSNCRIVKNVRRLHDGAADLAMVSIAELSNVSASRIEYGVPRFAALTFDSSSDPPLQQIELYPIPSSPDSVGATLSFVVDYTLEEAALDATQTSANLLIWMRPAALEAGVLADTKGYKEDYNGAQYFEGQYDKRVDDMLRTNAKQIPPQRMRISRELLGKRGPYYRRGPWHEGFTG